MRYNYLLGGITVTTDILFPELVESPYSPEVEVSYGEVPEHLKDNRVDFPIVEANPQQYLLKIPRIARYLLEGNQRITIQLEPGALPSDAEKYILTTVCGALSYKRSFVPMHGGAFLLNGKAVLVTGASAMGKSSLLAALYQKGYQVISDDISNIKIIDGKAMLYPGFPRIMIWKDTIKRLQLDSSKAYLLRSDMEKYLLPIDAPHLQEPVPVSTVYTLKYDLNGDAVPEVQGREKVEILKSEIFQPWMAELLSNKNECYGQILLMASAIQLYLVENNRSMRLEDLADVILTKRTGQHAEQNG